MQRRLGSSILVVGAALLACGGGEKPKEAPKEPAQAAAQPEAPKEIPSAAPAPADTTPPKDVKPELSAGRSAMPTLDEWKSQTKEVTVKGSSALACETKILREYLRVSCRGKNDTGGTPTTIKVVRGGREALLFAQPGVTSVIVPYVEGTDFAADFSWTDKSHRLVATWPKGAPRPALVGVFEGAASPLDGTLPGDAKKLCDCHMKQYGAANCDELLGSPDADCDRTYGNDCDLLLACARGEPGAPPRCLPGFKNVGPALRCLKTCKVNADCPAGTTCLADWASEPVCAYTD